MKNRWKGGVA